MWLRSVAERLISCVREIDTVSRLGGDEFAILQCGLEKPEQAAGLARRIVEVLSAPYEIEGHRVTISVSIGISVAPGDGTSYDKLLKNSDVALYLAKADGRATWRFFEPEMNARARQRNMLEADLRRALDDHRRRERARSDPHVRAAVVVDSGRREPAPESGGRKARCETQ